VYIGGVFPAFFLPPLEGEVAEEKYFLREDTLTLTLSRQGRGKRRCRALPSRERERRCKAHPSRTSLFVMSERFNQASKRFYKRSFLFFSRPWREGVPGFPAKSVI